MGLMVPMLGGRAQSTCETNRSESFGLQDDRITDALSSHWLSGPLSEAGRGVCSAFRASESRDSFPPFFILPMSPSSPSLTTAISRSPSPVTPSTPDDNAQVPPLPAPIDLPTWYRTISVEPTSPSSVCWDENSPQFLNTAKQSTINILSLDDLIQDYPYDE